MALLVAPSPILIANLAWRLAELRKLYVESVRLGPAIFQTHLRLRADGGGRNPWYNSETRRPDIAPKVEMWYANRA